MKKMLIVSLFLAIMMVAGSAFACDGPECSASAKGNFKIGTFAVGGGLDADGALIERGAAGGISGAGGVAIGSAEGSVESFEVPVYDWVWVGSPWWSPWDYELIGSETVMLGSTEADLYNKAGGVTNTTAYADENKVGSFSNTSATTQGDLHVGAFMAAESHGFVAGAAAQGSLDGSIIATTPEFKSQGFSAGIAGQGSLGAFAGATGAVGLGSTDIEADIDMWGYTQSESYRAVEGNTEFLGTNVLTTTNVNTYGNVDRSLIGVGVLEGGYVAGGVAATFTAQKTDSGLAVSKAIGTYSGSGELNCNFTGEAVGGTQTSATQFEGMNGSIMSSSASMKVTINPVEK